MIQVRPMTAPDLEAVADLQAAAFPPPFDPELLWKAAHLACHIERFPQGQWVAETDGRIVGSCSNTRISESNWQAGDPWDTTVGGPFLNRFDPDGSTLYGLDISVHPDFRRMGIGRALYQARFDYVRTHGLTRYGTACRIPDFAASGRPDPENFAQAVTRGELRDRTLTPLLKMNLTYVGALRNYMTDPESGDAAAKLEWTP